MEKKLTIAEQRLLIAIRDNAPIKHTRYRTLESLWDKQLIYTLSRSNHPGVSDFKISPAGERALDDLSPASWASHKAVEAIVALGKLIDSDDPHVASDAREYMLGLAKCLNWELNGRQIGVVEVTKF